MAPGKWGGGFDGERARKTLSGSITDLSTVLSSLCMGRVFSPQFSSLWNIVWIDKSNISSRVNSLSSPSTINEVTPLSLLSLCCCHYCCYRCRYVVVEVRHSTHTRARAARYAIAFVNVRQARWHARKNFLYWRTYNSTNSEGSARRAGNSGQVCVRMADSDAATYSATTKDEDNQICKRSGVGANSSASMSNGSPCFWNILNPRKIFWRSINSILHIIPWSFFSFFF